jgi:ribose transport system substrate-binding protein
MIIAGCTQTKSSSAGGRKYSVAFLHSSFTDSLGQNALRAVEKAGEALGVEIKSFSDMNSGDNQLKTVENYISGGVDGILICPASDAVLPKIGQLCEKNRVWLMSCFRQVVDPDVVAVMAKNPWYLGTVYENEANTTQVVADALLAAGHTKFATFDQAPGMVAVDQRTEAFRMAIKNAVGAEIMATYLISNASNPAADIVPGFDMFIQSYPEVTAVFMAGSAGGMGEAAVTTVKSHNAVGKMKIGAFDSFGGMDAAFQEGILTVLATAHHADPFYAFIVLFNAINGHRLTEEKVNLDLNYMVLTDAETCVQLSEYVLNPKYDLYSPEEIKKFSVAENPSFTLQALKEEMDRYTLENVVTRIKSR